MNYRENLWAIKNRKAYLIVKSFNKKQIYSVEESISKILKYAQKNVPYYAKFNSSDIKNFPILTKNIIRSNFKELLSKNYKGKSSITYSGGSTGEPVPILQCEEYADWTNAILFSYFKNNFEKSWQEATTLEIWGSLNDIENKEGTNFYKKFKNIIYSSYCYNCFVFTEVDYKRCINLINRKKPFFLKGYTNSLLELAQYIDKKNIYVEEIPYILTRTCVLNNETRDFLQKVFKGRVFDLYGSREVAAIAAERSFGKLNEYYVFNKNCYVEVNENNELLITNFHNYSMPIIRFNIGDQSKLVSKKEDLQILGPIKGRIFDYIKFENGLKIHAQYFIQKFFKTSINQFQIEQTKINSILINYVDPFNDLTDEFKEAFEKDLQKLAKVEILFNWNRAKFIKKTKNGKYLYVKGLKF
ncbi:phenylacetate--CoA ligase family protein [Prochlorococcus marinus]|uniref:phenylacetate--CoA ligase family protein n=1 Tax=Prochlorococcus marinus TaxID=1219 RepID=UPI001ADC6C4B|nr:phenylacetate--CoA ligase family protein [Prochlorococcus marinus]MBO8204936.1 phenylacetate--CoA ligase family protein [Prochlorococcus marinus CUG1415]MBW3044208.1 hypothetical protein [Prochlorococcus marinus str. MU1415]